MTARYVHSTLTRKHGRCNKVAFRPLCSTTTPTSPTPEENTANFSHRLDLPKVFARCRRRPPQGGGSITEESTARLIHFRGTQSSGLRSPLLAPPRFIIKGFLPRVFEQHAAALPPNRVGGVTGLFDRLCRSVALWKGHVVGQWRNGLHLLCTWKVCGLDGCDVLPSLRRRKVHKQPDRHRILPRMRVGEIRWIRRVHRMHAMRTRHVWR